ncbi:MAG: cytochrome c [Candidatus Omnitrophica bacterium]|nr:cytochrome c [Candidatus Omnitrophota bacterium]
MRVALIILSFLAFLFVSAGLGGAQGKGDAKAGKAKYDQLCAGCHGTSGKGDGPAAGGLNPKPQDHTNGKYMNTLTDQYLFDIIKNGGVGIKKSPLMPAWGNQLKEPDIWNLVAYIRSLAKPPYKPPK